jgi:hypothetical protein
VAGSCEYGDDPSGSAATELVIILSSSLMYCSRTESVFDDRQKYKARRWDGREMQQIRKHLPSELLYKHYFLVAILCMSSHFLCR